MRTRIAPLPAPLRPFAASLSLLGLILCSSLPAQAQMAATASYRVTFQGTWDIRATPRGVRGDAHFSPLIGAVHNGDSTYWMRDAMATRGVEGVAEIGSTGTFRQEINASGNASAVLHLPKNIGATETTHIDFQVPRTHPLVTLITMIAPSPDWFVGVSRLSLIDANGQWITRQEVDLFPYDAGTEDGEGFSLTNPDTIPQGVITSIRGNFNRERGTGQFSNEPMAKLTFVRQDSDPTPLSWRVPLFPSASDAEGQQGFLRVSNHASTDGSVRIVAVDDAGMASEPLTLSIGANRTAHINSNDLEMGNTGKGLTGNAPPGQGDWRLELQSSLDLQVFSYIRTRDGFVTSMHDSAPLANNRHRVVFFNPGANTNQVSLLRLINPGTQAATVTITGTDDRGMAAAGSVELSLPAGGARTVSSANLENGADGLTGRFGDGGGKWRLLVASTQPIIAMSLLQSPTGHLTNLSTAPNLRVQAQ